MKTEPSAGRSVSEGNVDAFLAEVIPMLERMDRELHDGNAGPRHEHWSHRDPVTLFGAVMTKRGWKEIGPAFDALATRFSDCASFQYEVVAASVSGDLGYIAGLEHTTASVGGGPVETYHLRVTTILRRENGAWKVVHRHGDTPPETPETRDSLDRLTPAESR
ncbi:MAG TPA: nuclear transport factor 2 family protein [Candidatus Thermoplasmatota archaeon]|nr:nuclear transport factor 2 family protein [Candidatus Thermoplasmatota archaeon]